MTTKTEAKETKAELHVRVRETVLDAVRHAIVDRRISLGEAVAEALDMWLDFEAANAARRLREADSDTSIRVDTKPTGGGR